MRKFALISVEDLVTQIVSLVQARETSPALWSMFFVRDRLDANRRHKRCPATRCRVLVANTDAMYRLCADAIAILYGVLRFRAIKCVNF